MSVVDLAYLIDDDDIYVFGMKRMIKANQLCDELLTFTNGADAIDFINERIASKSSLPKVILIDINMPVMDGWGFIDEFAKIPAEFTDGVTVYMISSSVQEEDRMKAESINLIKSYHVKPIDKEELISMFQVA
ncbi:MAG: response regulator [Bacteroidetes bacterium]|uniref:Response regulator n=1 Tax=Phaeocystidibacter marisrubri TaxID=1577780 RepID=A0A6L3ZCS3_9FLAO|nr:response regulator [Phaeocystidibacter marisrubri]KAB2815261.1 response regulator [Phaeocystidibacter marisrubri]TNE31533.1 MAG: response regulator [Bacteroidota bacterium]GGH71183.1 response regulator [Phaeocystidibacter marisrubri]